MKIETRRNTYGGPTYLSLGIYLTRSVSGVTIGIGHTDYVLEVYRDDAE